MWIYFWVHYPTDTYKFCARTIISFGLWICNITSYVDMVRIMLFLMLWLFVIFCVSCFNMNFRIAFTYLWRMAEDCIKSVVVLVKIISMTLILVLTNMEDTSYVFWNLSISFVFSNHLKEIFKNSWIIFWISWLSLTGKNAF